MGGTAEKDLGERLYLFFIAGGVEFCASLRHVEEISHWEPKSAGSRSKKSLAEDKDSILHRGESVPVVDFAKLLGLDEPTGSQADRWLTPDASDMGMERNVVVTCNPDGKRLGLAVGRIAGINDLHPSRLMPFSGLLSGEGVEVFGGFCRTHDGLVILVDLPAIANEAAS